MASTPATPLRLAVAGLIHETNTYAAEFAGQTPLRAFEQYSGQDQILQAFDRSNHQVGGFIEGARGRPARNWSAPTSARPRHPAPSRPRPMPR